MKWKIIAIAAPSGSGKTTIANRLLSLFQNLSFSISATTRTPRNNEIDGINYHFLTVDDFKQGISENKFLEWEMVYEGKYYGTLQSEIGRIWENNKIPLLDMDVKGALHLRDQYPKQTLTIFIDPPSSQELENRLRNRGTETEESLKMRMGKSVYEMTFRNSFDHIILNDDLDIAVAETQAAIHEFLNS